MSTASEGRPRPEPIRITDSDLNTRSLRTRMAFKSPAWSASPLSPLSRPLPMHPETRDEEMRQHDMATITRLEPRSRNSPNIEPTRGKVLLKPISELALPAPLANHHLLQRPPLSAPLLAPPQFRRPTIVEETRNMLLFDRDRVHGLPSTTSERRMSAPSGELLARSLQHQRQREHVRRRLMGVYGPREPDLLVIPVEHRRLSTIHTSDEGGLLTPFSQDGRLTIRFVIHSRGRKPAVAMRTFDVEDLRATIPDPSQSPLVQASRRASLANLQTPITRSRPVSPAMLSTRRHSSVGTHNLEPTPSPALERRGSRHEMIPSVPMHLEYARAYLPVLASIILSEIVGPGDTIELPLPHPRAWKDTVAYIYTGRVELTEPIKRNILYLGGKV